MARRPRRSPQLNALLEPYSKQFRDAFIDAVNDLAANADVARVVRALENNDLNAAVLALHIDASAFDKLRQTFAQSYQAAGDATAAAVPALLDHNGERFVVRFNGNAQTAQAWIEQEAGDMIREITSDQLAMSRDQLSAGLRARENPRSTALDLVGRIDRRTGKRTGGTLGLTEHQAQLVRNAKNQLVRGGNADLRGYLSRELRNKSFDRHVFKALKDKTMIPPDVIESMTRSYKNSFLRYRGETVARTETLKSLHAAQLETYNQMISKGQVRQEQVRRVWHTAQDSDVRDSHDSMEGQSVGQDEPFISGAGTRLMYPGDPGAPAEEIINCRCDVTMRIDFLSNLPPIG